MVTPCLPMAQTAPSARLYLEGQPPVRPYNGSLQALSDLLILRASTLNQLNALAIFIVASLDSKARRSTTSWIRRNRRSPMSASAIQATPEFIAATGVAFWLATTTVTYFALPSGQRRADFGIVLLVMNVGAGVGALIGTLASPDPGERDTFKTIAGLGSAFLTGFIVKWFEQELKTFFTATAPTNRTVLTALLSFILAAFLSAFVLYAYRVYTREPDSKAALDNLSEIRKLIEKVESND
jgi:hypothetical protein